MVFAESGPCRIPWLGALDLPDPDTTLEIDHRHLSEPAEVEALCDGVEVITRLVTTPPLAAMIKLLPGPLSVRSTRDERRAEVGVCSDDVSPVEYVPHGTSIRRDGRRRSCGARPWDRGAAGGRRLDLSHWSSRQPPFHSRRGCREAASTPSDVITPRMRHRTVGQSRIAAFNPLLR